MRKVLYALVLVLSLVGWAKAPTPLEVLNTEPLEALFLPSQVKAWENGFKSALALSAGVKCDHVDSGFVATTDLALLLERLKEAYPQATWYPIKNELGGIVGADVIVVPRHVIRLITELSSGMTAVLWCEVGGVSDLYKQGG